jgi:hypothetical protein
MMITSRDIVGYTYQADNHCPECTAAIAGIPGLDAEPALTVWAALCGITRGDEHSFDSGDFPKVITAQMAEHDASWGADNRCGSCFRPFDGDESGTSTVQLQFCRDGFDITGDFSRERDADEIRVWTPDATCLGAMCRDDAGWRVTGSDVTDWTEITDTFTHWRNGMAALGIDHTTLAAAD